MGTISKDLNTEQAKAARNTRFITSFGFTFMGGDTAGNDFLQSNTEVRKLDAADGSVILVSNTKSMRFSELEIRSVIGTVQNLPDYDKLRTALSKLVHALVDNRESQALQP